MLFTILILLERVVQPQLIILCQLFSNSKFREYIIPIKLYLDDDWGQGTSYRPAHSSTMTITFPSNFWSITQFFSWNLSNQFSHLLRCQFKLLEWYHNDWKCSTSNYFRKFSYINNLSIEFRFHQFYNHWKHPSLCTPWQFCQWNYCEM